MPLKVVHSCADVQDYFLPLVRKGREPLFLVLIGGCSRAGKTFLSEWLAEDFKKKDIPTLHLPLDHWLVDVRKRSPESKVLDRFEGSAIVQSVQRILLGETIYPPVYDPISRERVAEAGEKPYGLDRGVILVEGVIGLALEKLREMAQMKIYVEIPDVIRLERLQIFYRSVKGLAEKGDSIIQLRELEEIPFIRSTRQWADLIVQFQ